MAKQTKTPKAKTTAKPKTKATAKAKAPAQKKKASTSKVSTKLKGLDGTIKLLAGKPSTRRPPNNPDVPQVAIDNFNSMLNDLKQLLDNYSQHLRALDRKRLNGVGIRKLGFIERSYEFALENAEFLPHYLTLDRFGKDIQYFMDFRSLFDLTRQISEKFWNIVIQSSDIAYTDALEFYASVREAAKRRVDAAETIHHDLSLFFPRKRHETEEPTEARAKKDFNALLHGKHDGKLVIENISPKMTGGRRKLVDKTYRDTAQFKETEAGEFTE